MSTMSTTTAPASTPAPADKPTHLCPFTYSGGKPGYSLYKGSKRISKHKLPEDKTCEEMATDLGLTYSEFPPKANKGNS